MKASYANDPTLYERCLTTMDTIFPGVKKMADQGRARNACWDKASTPFILEKSKKVIAHVGLLPFEVVVEGNTFHAAAVHGIYTIETERRKGYFKQLMNEALLHVQQHYIFSFLFTDQPWLYEPFGFRVVPEHDFKLKSFQKSVSTKKVRKLDLENPLDLSLMQSLYLNRLPLSNRFGIVNESVVATLNASHLPVYYLDSDETLVVYDVKDETLWLKDIVFKKSVSLQAVINAIPETFLNVVLQFCPDQFSDDEYIAMDAHPDGFFMISAEYDVGKNPFRYPEPYRC